jgi:hypothetical protein
MMRHLFVVGLLAGAAWASGGVMAAAASDEAPGSAEQMTNPSKSEPMMVPPSPGDEAAAYERDLADCALHSPEGQQICRDMVNEEYGMGSGESSQALARCDVLEGAAKQACLRRARLEQSESKTVKSRLIKKEAGHRPGFVA